MGVWWGGGWLAPSSLLSPPCPTMALRQDRLLEHTHTHTEVIAIRATLAEHARIGAVVVDLVRDLHQSLAEETRSGHEAGGDQTVCNLVDQERCTCTSGFPLRRRGVDDLQQPCGIRTRRSGSAKRRSGRFDKDDVDAQPCRSQWFDDLSNRVPRDLERLDVHHIGPRRLPRKIPFDENAHLDFDTRMLS